MSEEGPVPPFQAETKKTCLSLKGNLDKAFDKKA